MVDDLKWIVDTVNVGNEELLLMLTYAQSPVDFSIQIINQEFNIFNEKLNHEYQTKSKDKEYR